LQHVTGDRFQAEANGPAIHGLKGENLQEKKIESALDQVRWLAHVLSSLTEGMIPKLLSVNKGKESGRVAVGEHLYCGTD
jgi:hypothetical protein